MTKGMTGSKLAGNMLLVLVCFGFLGIAVHPLLFVGGVMLAVIGLIFQLMSDPKWVAATAIRSQGQALSYRLLWPSRIGTRRDWHLVESGHYPRTSPDSRVSKSSGEGRT